MDGAPTNPERPIVVHSHLRWSGIWQRPQQTHARLARSRPVTFVEEPLAAEGDARLGFGEPTPGVLVVQPHLPERLLHDRDAVETTVVRLLARAAESALAERTGGAVHWLYTPMMLAQVDSFRAPAALVYDCMDELAQFLGAPEALRRREADLLAAADVVFCGGPALFDAKRGRHPNVHLFGCGVDYEHFHAACDATAADPALAELPRPRLGYIGAIDERLDYELLEALAEEHHDWQLVMVGPVVKVDPGILPRGPNVHLLGPRPYADLPRVLAGLDLCLMPFALNEATQFINPTKTLEYLATGRPVVSTPVRDVVRGFGDVVTVVDAGVFPEAIAGILGAAHHPRAGLERARAASWDGVVEQMAGLVRAAVSARASASGARSGPAGRRAAAPA